MAIFPKLEEKGSMTAESKIYVYATEMVAEYYSFFDISGKSVLTIIGSGDQILNAYFFGAKDVTGFDINNRSEFFVNLKIEAIRKLKYNEFLLFFGDSHSTGRLDKDTYLKLRDSLPETTVLFFDKLYEDTGDGNPLKSEYFRERSFLECDAKDINAYLKNENNYLILQKIMQKSKPEFFLGNIKELVHRFPNNRYEIINMSNVFNYFVGRKEELVSEMLEILKSLHSKLRSEGSLFFYSYSPLIYGEDTIPPASRPETIDKIRGLGIFDVEEKSFTGTNKVGLDKITILIKQNAG